MERAPIRDPAGPRLWAHDTSGQAPLLGGACALVMRSAKMGICLETSEITTDTGKQCYKRSACPSDKNHRRRCSRVSPSACALLVNI
jgi:hypothetical protein